MDYNHKSGATKRKEREERDKSWKKGQSTFESIGFFHSGFGGSKKQKTETNDLANVDCNGNNKSQSKFDQPTVDSKSHCSDTSTGNLEESNVNTSASVTSAETTSFQKGHVEYDVSNLISIKCVPISKHEKHEQDLHKSKCTSDCAKPLNFDIGKLDKLILSGDEIREAIFVGAFPYPREFPDDNFGHKFPHSILTCTLKNGESVQRDWLVWSQQKNALFCFPCRLFSKLPASSRSLLACPLGYSTRNKWRKLWDRISSHENSVSHKMCYVEWRSVEKRVGEESTIDNILYENLRTETDKWRQILKRILDVILFLGERGLALRGDSHHIGDPKNGNFLGILELISHYDLLLNEHLNKVKDSQMAHRRLQVHYLSADIQNEFIQVCADHVLQAILKEREMAKYYSIIVDATPDSAHVEQTCFILRFLKLVTDGNLKQTYTIEERFLAFVDCHKKTGEAIADLICVTLQNKHIPLSDCRGQGYDNGSNMSGRYKGAQSRILNENPLAAFSPCACHTLNLCGVEAAESCSEAVTFFGILQKLFNMFSCSTQRWEILQKAIGCSLHSMSETRWSARIDCVKPFAMHLSRIKEALINVQELNISAETLTDIKGIQKYMNTFECVLLSSIWFKVLTSINYRNTVLQARNITMYVQLKNINSLIEELKVLRGKWDEILQECKLVYMSQGMSGTFSQKRIIKKRLADGTVEDNTQDSEQCFKCSVFYVILDCVIANITSRYDAMHQLDEKFNFLWMYPTLSTKDIQMKVRNWLQIYRNDASDDIFGEMEHLKVIQPSNFEDSLTPLQLLNTILDQKLGNIFPNVCVALRIFCTLPVSVAEAERSFSTLSRVKNIMRSTMIQQRLTDLGLLAMESALARQLNFTDIINIFASKKARKALL